ncbi:hypothetical protein IAU59_003149 [Kwoniella sp. CBS 9459]
MASKIPQRPPLQLKRATTLDIGTTFENHALRYLNKGLYMNVRRVGGAGDGGIDLRGWWWLPKSNVRSSTSSSSLPTPTTGPSSTMGDTRRVKVIAQCKAEKKALGPRAIREMEGVMAGLAFRLARSKSRSSSPISTLSETEDSDVIDADIDEDKTIALLISQSGFSKSTMTQATSSGTPLMLIHLPGGRFDPADQDAERELVVAEDRDGVTQEQGEFFWLPSFSHLPELIRGRLISSQDQKSPKGTSGIHVESIWWNRALSHNILGNSGSNLELRKTMIQPKLAGEPMGVGVALWMDGKPVGRRGPP